MERKVVLITGATSGIGEACARKFAEGGYDLILTGRNEDKLKAICEKVKAFGADVLPLTLMSETAELPLRLLSRCRENGRLSTC